MSSEYNPIPVIHDRIIFEALSKTEAGRSLKNTRRWSSYYNNEPERVWREVVGASGNVWGHSKLFYGLGRAFLRNEAGRYSLRERETFLYGLTGHDFGEALIDGNGVGDIEPKLKTRQIEEQETRIAYEVITSLEINGHLRYKLAKAYEEVVVGTDPKLHHAFRALEKTEYVMNTLKVFQNTQRAQDQGKPTLKDEKKWVGLVLVNNLAFVIDNYAADFPNSIGRYLGNMEGVIDAAYAHTKDWLEDSGHGEKSIAFAQKWEEFKQERSRAEGISQGFL